MAEPQRQEAQIMFNHLNINLSSHFTDREQYTCEKNKTKQKPNPPDL